MRLLYDSSTAMADRQAWYTLDIVEARSKGGATLTKQPDGSILVSGAESDQDEYTIIAKSRVRGVAGLRLDALADKSLTSQGPGRAGDFVLSKIVVEQAVKKEGPYAAVELKDPTASFASPDYPPNQALDDDPATGWSLGAEGLGKSQNIRFALGEKLAANNETYFKITLSHHSKYALGRFLLSATSRNDPVKLTSAASTQLPGHVYSFQYVKPKSAVSEKGAELLVQADNSVLAGGKNVPGDVYEVVLETPIAGITAFLLEAMTDDSIQKKGPGRLAGMFSISELTVQVASKATPDKKQNVELEDAVADVESKKGQEPTNMIDGKPVTVWTNSGDVGEARKAVFFVKGKAGASGGSIFTFRIEQKANLGKFRLGLITSTNRQYIADLAAPKPDPNAPALVEFLYNVGGPRFADAQKKTWNASPAHAAGKSGFVGPTSLRPQTIEKIPGEPFKSYLENVEGFKAVVPPGVYQVQLYFVEPNERQVSGYRQFDIYIEGRNMGKVVNILQESGGFGKPAIKTFGPITVTDGTIDIEFKGKGRILSAVAIVGKAAPAPAAK
jgi:hypothetical protein